MLRYLAACLVAGAVVGRAFGPFARASFHYPLRRADASAAHRALLDALDVVEWPSLFASTLLVSLVLWRWMRPSTLPAAAGGSKRAEAATFAVCLPVGLLAIVPASHPEGRVLAALWAVALAALVAWLVCRSWAEAGASPGPRRVVAQLPVPAGHLTATIAASLSLGYTGESALVHGIALLSALFLFLAEVILALVIAAVRAGTTRSS